MNRFHRSTTAIAIATALILGLAAPVLAASKDEEREHIDQTSKDTLRELFTDSPKAKELYDKSYGIAVFTNIKVSLGISGGGGSGVAINRQTKEKTYMKMGTAGVGFGFGGQKYKVVFLFQSSKAFENFVEKGWQAEAAANASAGTAGANAAAGFVNGVAIYQITEAGLMASADISGTKYWKNGKLN